MSARLNTVEVQALRWIDQFGTERRLPDEFELPFLTLLAEGFALPSGIDQATITADGKKYLTSV
ncbi:hypothetical protein [Nocardia sp. NPDC052566]|uniref:hypothetical protein n=1 Tax=Nocardia sp. NPDC052566 TaxID=3364330 RepID=UPI0037C9F168